MKKFKDKFIISKNAKKYYEKDYKKNGYTAQRRYPNEELVKFFGRNFFSIKKIKRKKIKILETGCGTCGNLWMISKEGFSTYGIDFSHEAIKLAKKFFNKEKLKAYFTVGDFRSMEYKKNFFDSVVDVFSSCILDRVNGVEYIQEVKRILKKEEFFLVIFHQKNLKCLDSKLEKCMIKIL